MERPQRDDAPIEIQNVDGATIEVWADGFRFQTNLDGSCVSVFPNGSVLFRTVDGVEQLQRADGSVQQTQPNGMSVERWPDGRQRQTNPDGQAVEMAADGTVTRGIVVPDDAAAGTVLSISLPDGRIVSIAVPAGVAPGAVLSLDAATLVPPTVETPWMWQDGNDSSASDASESDEGPTYTSGEEDASGPRLLEPSEWRARHTRRSAGGGERDNGARRCSRFRREVRPYRVHYFHNQRDGALYQSAALSSVIDRGVAAQGVGIVERVDYASVVPEGCFGRFSAAGGCPVLLRAVPGAPALQAAMAPAALCYPAVWASISAGDAADGDDGVPPAAGGFGTTRFRVCHQFEWGEQPHDGRLELRDFVRLVSQYPKADVPFYLFEDDFDGVRHSSHAGVDAWSDALLRDAHRGSGGAEAAVDSGVDAEDGGADAAAARGAERTRADVASLYTVPSLFQSCLLCVPKSMRPTSTDGVFLMGALRSGSFPHVDPSSTAAWNWLLHGEKRWCLFPPNVDAAEIGAVASADAGMSAERNGEGGSGGGDDDDRAKLLANGAGYWWSEHYPRLVSSGSGAALGMVECVQQAGEVIYVPEGWWHAVLNVSPWTTAVTHNVVLRDALPTAFAREARLRPLFARRWLACLHRFSPDAAMGLEASVPDAVAAAMAALDEAEADGAAEEVAEDAADESMVSRKKADLRLTWGFIDALRRPACSAPLAVS